MKKAIIMMLIIASTLIILDLYVPFERIIGGDKLTFTEIAAYINIRHHLTSILAIGTVLGVRSARKAEITNRGNKQ